jgi:hypothetical protein
MGSFCERQIDDFVAVVEVEQVRHSQVPWWPISLQSDNWPS